MTTVDYDLFYRRAVSPGNISVELPRFDVFVSAFNSSKRVNLCFEKVRAGRKVWLVHPEYGFSEIERPRPAEVIVPEARNEVAQVDALLSGLGNLKGADLCVDITGFMRHVLLFLVAKLGQMGCERFSAIYTEPDAYVKQENTTFCTRTEGTPRTIFGMSNGVIPNAKEFLVVFVGFDHALVGEVAHVKDSATVFPVFAFPSLSADMYQQSAVRAASSGEVALDHGWHANRRFAPANDPFVTADTMRRILEDIRREQGESTVYIAPLSTKVQTLGSAIFWHLEGRRQRGVNMLLPQLASYARGTSDGLKRLWIFDVELDV